MMRRVTLRVLLGGALGLALLLTACGSGELLNDAYTAAGDGTRLQDVTKTTTFRHDDDLNVVIVLNAHSRELEVGAVFNAPDGAVYGTDTLEADETVGEVLLGLDWESQNGAAWAAGEWTVDVQIDENTEKTLRFTVAGVPDASAEG